MPLPITIPNTFANATATIPLSQLDNNFATVAVAVNSIGNGAFSLANVQVTGGTIANVTLDNVSVDVETLSNVTITNLTVNGNATFTNAAVTANTATITTANVTTANVTNFISGNVSITGGTANLTTANVTNLASSNAVITGGSLENVTIGSATAAAANVTSLTVNGNTTLGDASTDAILMTAAPSIGGAGLGMGFGFRNRIINGAMVIDQRNAGASVNSPSTAATAYTLDRWQIRGDTEGVFSIQQDSSAPEGFVNSLKITVTTIDSSLGATQLYNVAQQIEGTNVSDLGFGTATAKTVTLSFWVRSSLTGTFGGALRNSAGSRSYPFTYAISVADTWEYKTVTIPGDTSGTWLTTTGIGISVLFALGAGADRTGTAGAWVAANNSSATGATNVMATLNATWYITGVQLEKGSTATSFDYRPYGTELALCQRYYATGNYPIMRNFTGVSLAVSTSVALPVTMRATPTVTASVGTVETAYSNVISSYQTSIGSGASTATSTYTAAIEL